MRVAEINRRCTRTPPEQNVLLPASGAVLAGLLVATAIGRGVSVNSTATPTCQGTRSPICKSEQGAVLYYLAR